MNPDEVREKWAERSGEYSPEYYAYRGPNAVSERIRERIDATATGPAPAVLELGCSSGRHLAHLHEHGYRNLHGIEINEAAFEVMAEAYPELADDGTFYRGAIEDVVGEFPDDRFDVVYSVETLQHVHPEAGPADADASADDGADASVFAELARIVDALLLTVENEHGGNDDDERGDDPTGGPAAGDDRERGHGQGRKRERERERERDSGSESEPGTGTDTGTDAGDDGVEVTRVRGEVPLYHRNWRRVFTDLGLVEVDAAETRRDTLRAFRPDAD